MNVIGQPHRIGKYKMEENKKFIIGWKAIADFLDASIKSAQRWKNEGGLPVMQPVGKHSRVYAKTSELNDWIRRKKGFKI